MSRSRQPGDHGTALHAIYSVLQSDRGRLTVAIFVAAGLLTTYDLYPHKATLGALILLPVAFLLRPHPGWSAACLALIGVLLRLGWGDLHTGDQIMVAQQAAQRVLEGLSPYGVWYDSFPPQMAPYPYGPLGWAWWQGGVTIEMISSTAIMAVLIWRRAWLTLAFFSCWSVSIAMNLSGINDYSMTLFVLLALALAESHPRLAAMAAAMATGLKLQAVAWIPPLFVFMPNRARLVMAAALLIIWAPLTVWGVDSLLRSIGMVEQIHAAGNGAGLHMPWLRLFLPIVLLLFLRVRSVPIVAASGSAIFVLVMFAGDYGNISHWIPILSAAFFGLELSLLRSPRMASAETSEARQPRMFASPVPAE